MERFADKKKRRTEDFYRQVRNSFSFRPPSDSIEYFQKHDHCVSFREPLSWEKTYEFVDGIPFPAKGQFNPVTVAQYGISKFDFLKNKVDRKTLYNELEPLEKELISHHPEYTYDFPLKKYGLVPPWRSTLAWANVLSFYLRMDSISGTNSDRVQDLVDAFIREKDLRLSGPDGQVWFEEYESASPSLVLNGFISVIIALYEYLVVYPGNEQVTSLVKKCVSCLLVAMPHFDNGIYLKYDLLHGSPIDKKYYEPHYHKFLQLHELTGQDEYRAIASRMKLIMGRMNWFYDLVDALYYCHRNDLPVLFSNSGETYRQEFKKGGA